MLELSINAVAPIPFLPAQARVQILPGTARTDRAAVLKRLAKQDLLIDEDHASIYRAPQGAPSPACGWLTDPRFEADGSLTAAVAWTPHGTRVAPNFQALEPAVLLRAGTIVALHSVGLVQEQSIPPYVPPPEEPEPEPALNSAEERAAAAERLRDAWPSLPPDVRAMVAEASLTPAQLKVAKAMGIKPEDLAPPPAAAAATAERDRIERVLGLGKP